MSDIKPKILLPKGEALPACNLACQQELQTELPTFDGRDYRGETTDYDVYWLKPKDIVGLMARGVGDIAVVGTDIVLEYMEPADNLTTRRAGIDAEPMCRFSLLALEGKGEEIMRRSLDRRSRSPGVVVLPTGNPRMLTTVASFRDRPVVPYGGIFPTGSVEVYAKLLGAPGVADLVQYGKTAAANDLIELISIYPELVTRNQQ